MSSKILQEWPEPIVRVQALSESNLAAIPDRYVKLPTERPTILDRIDDPDSNIPIIDLSRLFGQDSAARAATLSRISGACREWGFFQVINHGVRHELMDSACEVWREFFHAPMEVKQVYANSPTTYEGYGSRLGVQKGAILDWSDYFFLHFRPNRLLDHQKWPSSCREVMEVYGEEVAKLCGELLKALSVKLGLDSDQELQDGLGGEEIRACLRVNYYLSEAGLDSGAVVALRPWIHHRVTAGSSGGRPAGSERGPLDHRQPRSTCFCRQYWRSGSNFLDWPSGWHCSLPGFRSGFEARHNIWVGEFKGRQACDVILKKSIIRLEQCLSLY